MQITRLTPYLVAPRPSPDGWSKGQITLLVKLDTKEGLIGWGEAYALSHRQEAICKIMGYLGAVLTELPNASPRAFIEHVATPMATKHPSIDFAAAQSAIEIALWDLLGKSTGLPLHALLGGAIQSHVPIYANAWDNPVQAPQAIAERCAMMREQGYRAVKIYPMRQPTLDLSEETVRLTREAIGPDVDLMLDFACQKDSRRALKAARSFEAYDPYWIEEPVPGDDPIALADFRARTDLRVVTGERQAGLRHYRDILHHRAADVLNPDIAGVGGILTTLEIGTLAQAHSTLISPHSWNSTTVAYAAMIHVCAVMPNAIYGELYYDYLHLGMEFGSIDCAMENGACTLPSAPGLGVEIDEAALKALCLS